MQRNQECEEKCKAGKNDHVQLIPVLEALLSLAVDYSQYRLNYYNQFLDRYYLSDLCNLEERLLRGLNIIGDESNEPSADLPFSAKVSISNVLTELWFTKYFGFNLSQIRRENFIDAFEMEYGKQPADNMSKLWSILQMIEREKIKTYECDKVSLMRRHNSNTDILGDCMQSDLANNFLLKTSTLSTSNSNSESDEEDDLHTIFTKGLCRRHCGSIDVRYFCRTKRGWKFTFHQVPGDYFTGDKCVYSGCYRRK